MVESGEASACLSLAGNYVVMLKDHEVGLEFEWRFRNTLPGFGSQLLGPSFFFKIAAICGSGSHARAVLFETQPSSSNHLYVVMRGVRVGPDANSAKPSAAKASAKPSSSATHARERAQVMRDADHMCFPSSRRRDWLPSKQHRVPSGIDRYLDKIWTEPQPAATEQSGPADPGGRSAAPAQLLDAIDAYLASLPPSTPPPRITFVGISFGGALAQLGALRLSLERPALAPVIHVLAFGPTCWAEPLVAELFEATFGQRAAQLVNGVRRSPRDTAMAEGLLCEWTFGDEAFDEAWAGGDTGVAAAAERSALGEVSLDPLSIPFLANTVPLRNAFVLWLPPAFDWLPAVLWKKQPRPLAGLLCHSRALSSAMESPRPKLDNPTVAIQVAELISGIEAPCRLPTANLRRQLRSRISMMDPTVLHSFFTTMNEVMEDSSLARDFGTLHAGRSYRAVLLIAYLHLRGKAGALDLEHDLGQVQEHDESSSGQ